MKKILTAICLGLALGTINTADAKIRYVEETSYPLLSSSNENASPAIYDIDGDGLLDMMLYSSRDNTLHLFTQESESNPYEFVSHPNGEETGLYIHSIYGEMKPTIADIDDNGLLDIVVGLGSSFGHFEQSAATEDAYDSTTFTGDPYDSDSIESMVEPTSSTSDYTVEVTDLDGDGLTDMIVGADDGKLYRYELDAIDLTTYNFIGTLKNRLGNDIDVGLLSAAAIADLDNDGLLDLVVGSYLGIRHYEQSPIKSDVFNLVTDSSPLSISRISLDSTHAFPEITDLNGDGLLDLVFGDKDGTIYFYRAEEVLP